MKIFTASDIREIDRATIENEGIASIDLMERAASAITFEIVSRWGSSQRILILQVPETMAATLSPWHGCSSTKATSRK